VKLIRGCAVTIGNFDGVHLGHHHLIKNICQQADARKLRACAVSFEPLPVEYFLGSDKSPPRIASIRDKISILNATGIDQLLLMCFNKNLAETTADDFIKQVLIDHLDTKYLMIGDDFEFGKNRSGNIATLKAASQQYGVELHQADTLERSGERVSSSQIRKLLTDGDITTATELLGRHYAIEGKVTYGAQLGRTIGYPTANIALKKHNPPLRGVFAVEVTGLRHGGTQPGIANIGVKPTVHGVQLSLEVHMLDFKADLYGKRLQVVFLHKLRDEQKFSGLEELKAAIATDEQNARQWFAQTS